jgi:hypothetical protein
MLGVYLRDFGRGCAADLGLEAYDRAVEWMAKHGDDEI